MSVDMKARVIASHATRKVEKAGHSGVLARRTAELPFMLALVVSFCAVRDVVQPDRRFQPERHRSPGRHQKTPKDERCGHGRSVSSGSPQKQNHTCHVFDRTSEMN